MQISVVIPTLNAGAQLARLLEALRAQRVQASEILVVDSQSQDDTVRIAQEAGVRVMEIARQDFDHGGTRDMALRATSGEIVVFMTQDALPVDDQLFARLLEPLSDPAVAAVGARQIAYPDARPFEKAVRARNYPQEGRVWGREDIARLGVRAFMISDVCAAYRRSAYIKAGGFDHPILTNEDMLMVERLLRAGHRIAYSASAAVYHSHRFTLKEEFRRNYIIGRTMERYAARFDHVSEMGTGAKLAKDVLGDLVRGGHLVECFCFAANCAARLLGNRMGRRAEARASAGQNGDM